MFRGLWGRAPKIRGPLMGGASMFRVLALETEAPIVGSMYLFDMASGHLLP